MLISIKSRSDLKLGHVWSTTSLLGQVIEKPCVHCRGTVLIKSSLNFVRMLILIISRSNLKLGHIGSKTRSLDQINMKNLCKL